MSDSFTLEALPPAFELLGPRWAADAPLWSARVKVLAESLARAARPVYYPSRARDVLPGPIDRFIHFPGTLHVRLRVEAVRLRLGDTPTQFFSADRPTDVTMLVNANPDRWSGSGPFAIDQMICIAGQFPLSPFFGPNLERLPASFEKNLKGVFPDRTANLVASSSGFILDGRPKMPDRPAALLKRLPFLLEVAAPQDEMPAGGTFVIRVDGERLSEFAEGKVELLAYFRDLVQRLNPADPNNDQALLKWLRLELTDPTRLPDFYWKVRPSEPNQPKLLFAPGEWKLFVSDQALRDQKISTRGVLTGTPDVVVAADRVTADAKAELVSPTPNGEVRYEGLIEAADRSQESIRLINVQLGYDAIDAASRLRAIYELPIPRADDVDAIEDSARLTGRVPNSDGKIDPPALWGCMPLADGWAQLPFLNLTEQLLIDALPRFIPPPPPSPPATPPTPAATPVPVASQFRGAALFGTDRAELFDVADGRSPWNLAVLDADQYHGEWKFQGQKLESVTLKLTNPEITAEGLFEIATAAPTTGDALATLDDWVGGLTALPLRTPSFLLLGHQGTPPDVVSDDPYPCPFLLHFAELKFERANRQSDPTSPIFSVAKITAWDWAYEANPLVHKGTVRLADVEVNPQDPDKVVDREFPFHAWLTALPRSRYPLDRVWGTTAIQPERAQSGLAWRRHPSHPCVQVLPLTQNAVPPNHLSNSRQLVPFGLKVKAQGTVVKYLVPDGWRFVAGATDSTPRAAVPMKADVAWTTQPRLALAPLGIPGAALGVPSPAIGAPIPDSSGFLDRFLYRHDLPLLDQPNALADVPPENGVDASQPPPQALERGDYARHWATLENKAVLAETDEAEAAFRSTSGIDVFGLMEPRIWPAKIELDWNGFPGSLDFVDQVNPARKIELNGDDAKRDALRGFDGSFDVAGDKLRLGDPTTAPIRMVAGSFTAMVESSGGELKLRDQRGLSHGATKADTKLVTTQLILAKSSGDRPTTLCSLPAPVSLLVAGTVWKFWVKNLPTAGNGPFLFERTKTESPQGINNNDPRSPRRGVNDPGADGRDLGHLNGYEWRLGLDPKPDDPSWLPLGKFRFYPLSLDMVRLSDDGKVESAQIVGRLQLPAWNGLPSGGPSDKEFVNRDSAVKLIFENGTLRDVERAPADPDHGPPTISGTASWPLVDRELDTDAPVIFWDDIQGELDAINELTAIVLKATKYRIVYSRLGIVWTIAGDKDLRFPLDGSSPPATAFSFNLDPKAEVGVERVTLTLDLATARHRLTAAWVFRLGTTDQLQVLLKVNDELLNIPAVGNPLSAFLVHGSQETELTTVDSGRPPLDGFGLAVTWTQFSTGNNSDKQLLPGFHLSQEADACRGLAMLTFGLKTSTQPAAAEALPKFELRGGYADMLFACKWGDALQESLPNGQLPSFDSAFDSSAGRVLAEYHTALAPQARSVRWTSELSLSGMVEVKNLISWPAGLAIDNQLKITIPAVTDGPWHHWRHTANILLSEHRLRGVDPDQVGDSVPPILVGCDKDDCFLTLQTGTVWMLPATVEHQLVRIDVEANASGKPTVKLFAGEVRWTVVQEVRFCDANAMYKHLAGMARRNVIDPVRRIASAGWLSNSSWFSLHGLHSRTMLAALGVFDSAEPPNLRPFNQTRFKELGSTLLVEATVPLFLRVADADNRFGTSLVSAPGGTVVAGMSALSDFGHDPRMLSDDQWLFLPVAFLGRLQKKEPVDPSGLFATDPVQALAELPAAGTVPVLLRALTHRGGRTADQITTTNFDGPKFRFVRRLDPSSVAEAWFRLLHVRQLPPPAPGRDLPRGITSSAASDSAVVSARPPALVPLFDPRRPTLPPRELPSTPLDAASPTELVWTPDSIALLESRFEPELAANHPYAFFSFPVALLGSNLLQADRSGLRRHAAATLLPTPPLKDSSISRFQPVSLALSPFTAVGYRAWPIDSIFKPLLTTTELMVFDAARAKAESAVEQVIYPKKGLSDDVGLVAWGQETVARLAADSPTAMLRVRELREVGDKIGVDVLFRFLQIPVTHDLVDLSRRATAIRTAPDRVRYPQGQYGGPLLPPLDPTADFELAPPLVRGVQPLRFLTRPLVRFGVSSRTLTSLKDVGLPEDLVRTLESLKDQEFESEAAFLAKIKLLLSTTELAAHQNAIFKHSLLSPVWPWGLSGLRVVTAYRRHNGADVGTVGPFGDLRRIWWQAPAFRVQFAVPRDRQLLPAGFRTAAIPGFLPTWFAAPVPSFDQIARAFAKEDDTFDVWAPVLPGRRLILVTGLRPGAPLALRESITTQTFNRGTIVSASVPVQHRAPRPVLLPKPLMNQHSIALRTWGSWFDLVADEPQRLRTVAVSTAPDAEFSLVLSNGLGLGQRVILSAPTDAEISDLHLPKEQEDALMLRAAENCNGGELPGGWKGELSFRIEPLPNLADAGTWKLSVTLVIDGSTFVYKSAVSILTGYETFQPTRDVARLLEMFTAAKPGQVVAVKVTAQRDGGGTIKNYIQSAMFAVRVAGRPFPSHRAPRYLTWEDPEYNRRLASLAARKEKQIPLSGNQTLTLALVADRREYNSTGKITYAFVGTPASAIPGMGKFEFFIVGTDGNPVPTDFVGTDQPINQIPPPEECELANIRNGKSLKPGNILRIRLTVAIVGVLNPEVLELDLAIVALPVNPVPDAAYALLRRTGTTDECVRFAWGPDPARIELVDPDDLLGQVVRRRAVFTTTDTVIRSVAAATTYAVQKTTAVGATHFPGLVETVSS